MEDLKEDKKEAKSLNFHQMELDDRILKVRHWKREKNLSLFFKKIFILGDSKTWLDITDIDTRECYSFDAWVKRCPH